MLSGSLAQSCSLARLTVHALLAHFRLLMSDLENLRHACARAQIFQVRQQDSKGIEHSMYRKTVLTHFEEKRHSSAPGHLRLDLLWDSGDGSDYHSYRC